MVKILATVCFKPLFTGCNETFMCVGVVDSSSKHEDPSNEETKMAISKMTTYLGFSNATEYYDHYPGLAEDMVNKSSSSYTFNENDRLYYHPAILTFYTNPESGSQAVDVNDNYLNYFHMFLDPLTTAAANGCLYMVPGLGEMRQYNIIRSNFHKDELWFLERWDG